MLLQLMRLPLPLLLLLPTVLAAAVSSTTVPELRWTDAAAMLANSGWDYGWNSSAARCTTVVDPCTGPYARLPLAAKTGEWCDPPCPVRSQVWGEGQNGAVSQPQPDSRAAAECACHVLREGQPGFWSSLPVAALVAPMALAGALPSL